MIAAYCTSCAAPLQPPGRFCGRCGSAVVTVPRPSPHPVVAHPSASALRPSQSSRGTGRRVAAVSVALMVAILAGWVAHYVPAGDTRAHATGTAGEDPTATTDAAADAGPSGVAAPGDAATTSFVTSCGKLLDVVPTRAVAHDTAVQVTLELHPVCPTGEWIESRAFHVVLSDATGAELASGSFDLTDQPVLSPGFGDPASEVVARFGRGTAWASPDALAAAIADGTVVVACEAGDGMTGTPVPAGDVTGAVRRTVEASAPAPAAGRSREETALAALRRQARVDDPSVSLLEGAWVPQLSSKRSGTYDHHDAHAYSLADIYQQFLSLRLRFPNVRLLNSSDWGSYTLRGYWVVIAGVPYTRPNQPNGWCSVRRIPPSQCFAKRLVRYGNPDGATRHRA